MIYYCPLAPAVRPPSGDPGCKRKRLSEDEADVETPSAPLNPRQTLHSAIMAEEVYALKMSVVKEVLDWVGINKQPQEIFALLAQAYLGPRGNETPNMHRLQTGHVPSSMIKREAWEHSRHNPLVHQSAAQFQETINHPGPMLQHHSLATQSGSHYHLAQGIDGGVVQQRFVSAPPQQGQQQQQQTHHHHQPFALYQQQQQQQLQQLQLRQNDQQMRHGQTQYHHGHQNTPIQLHRPLTVHVESSTFANTAADGLSDRVKMEGGGGELLRTPGPDYGRHINNNHAPRIEVNGDGGARIVSTVERDAIAAGQSLPSENQLPTNRANTADDVKVEGSPKPVPKRAGRKTTGNTRPRKNAATKAKEAALQAEQKQLKQDQQEENHQQEQNQQEAAGPQQAHEAAKETPSGTEGSEKTEGMA